MPRTKTLPKTCYCCDAVATTREHIPPKCFFPEKKYLPSNSPDYRKNLLTVPSCEEHNNKRSADDEYTAVAIIMSIHGSEIAEALFKTKIMEALFREKSALAKKILNIKPVIVHERRGNLIIPPYETGVNTFKREIIDNVVKSIARGIYYHESKRKNKWTGDCIIKNPNFIRSDLSPNPEYGNLMQVSKTFDNLGLERKGSHPEIFYYQFWEEINQKPIIKMVFYNYLIFFALFKDSHS